MSQYHISRKPLLFMKILWYMRRSQLKFLTTLLICLLTGASREKLLDITVLRFLPELPFRDSTVKGASPKQDTRIYSLKYGIFFFYYKTTFKNTAGTDQKSCQFPKSLKV